MALRITIEYPSAEDASEKAIADLRKVESVLRDNLVKFTGTSWEKYRWCLDKEVSHQEYFDLVCHGTGKTLFSQAGSYFDKVELDKFISDLDFSIHEAMRKED